MQENPKGAGHGWEQLSGSGVTAIKMPSDKRLTVQLSSPSWHREQLPGEGRGCHSPRETGMEELPAGGRHRNADTVGSSSRCLLWNGEEQWMEGLEKRAASRDQSDTRDEEGRD